MRRPWSILSVSALVAGVLFGFNRGLGVEVKLLHLGVGLGAMLLLILEELSSRSPSRLLMQAIAASALCTLSGNKVVETGGPFLLMGFVVVVLISRKKRSGTDPEPP